MTHAVIKVRSDINVKADIRHTMKLMRLTRVNHCVILPDNEVSKGMLQKVKDYVTWGEVKPEVLARMVLLKGKLEGNNPISTAYIKSNTEYDTPLDFAKAVVSGKAKFASLDGIKPVIRLHPPISGYEGIKRAYTVGGALGYRGENINDLILRMLGPENYEKKSKAKPAAKKPAAAVKAKAPVKPKPKPKPVPKKPAVKTEAAPKPKPKPVAKKPVPKKPVEDKEGSEAKPKAKPVAKPKPVAKLVPKKSEEKKGDDE